MKAISIQEDVKMEEELCDDIPSIKKLDDATINKIGNNLKA